MNDWKLKKSAIYSSTKTIKCKSNKICEQIQNTNKENINGERSRSWFGILNIVKTSVLLRWSYTQCNSNQNPRRLSC